MSYLANIFDRKDLHFPHDPKAAIHRSASGAPGADAAIGSLARSGYIHCRGYASLLCYWVPTGGTTPTLDIQPLVLDSDGDLWISQPVQTGLIPMRGVIISVNSGGLFVRIDAVANVGGISEWKIILKPWDVRLRSDANGWICH